MMKYFNKYNWILLFCLLVTACGKDEDLGTGGGEFSPWNKDKTVSICFVSRFSEDALITTSRDYEPVYSALRTEQAYISLLDRCDVAYETEGITNPLIKIAKETKRIPVFAQNECSVSGCEGTGILLAHTLTRQDEVKIAADCFLKSVDTYLTSSRKDRMVLSTTRLHSAEHVKGGSSYLKAAFKRGELVIGTIKKELYPELESSLSNEKDSFILEKIETSGSYLLFVLASKSWTLRETKATKTENQPRVYLQIEQL